MSCISGVFVWMQEEHAEVLSVVLLCVKAALWL